MAADQEKLGLKRCFMITPIGEIGSAARKQADFVFHFLESACEDRGIKLERADKMAGSSMITTRIFEAVSSAELCVADLSNLNANVFYELGVRHSLRLPVIHIAHESTPLPFDNAQHDTIFYDLSDVNSMTKLQRSVTAELSRIGEDGYAVSNPLTHALGAITVLQSEDPKDQLVAQLAERISILERQEKSALRRRSPFSASIAEWASKASSLEDRILMLAGFISSLGDDVKYNIPLNVLADVMEEAGNGYENELQSLADAILRRFSAIENSPEALTLLNKHPKILAF